MIRMFEIKYLKRKLKNAIYMSIVLIVIVNTFAHLQGRYQFTTSKIVNESETRPAYIIEA